MDKDRAIFFIDARNIFHGGKESGGNQLSFKRLVGFLSEHYKIIRGYYYDGAPHRIDRTKEKERFFDMIRNLGITLRLKEMDFTRPNPSQKGVDIALTSDMISLAYEDAYDVAVLLSGDGDYVSLVELVKSKGKRVIVMSYSTRISASLKEVADDTLLIENHPALLIMPKDQRTAASPARDFIHRKV